MIDAAESSAVRHAALDETVILPKQRDPLSESSGDESDRWDRPSAVASAPVGGGVTDRQRALRTLAWILPTVIMAAVGFIRTSWPSLSVDELDTWAFANTPWSTARHLFAQVDALNAPYYGLMWLWAQAVGTSDFALRAPSLVAVTLAVGLTAALVSRLSGPRAGVLAGLALVALPTTSRLAQNATPAGLTMFGAVLSTYALVALFDNPGLRRYIGYLFAVVLLGLASPIALVMVLGHGVATTVMRPRALVGWFVAAVLGAAPGVAVLAVGRPEWQRHEWLPMRATLHPDGVFEGIAGTLAIGGMLLALALLSLSTRRPGMLLTACALLPIAALFGLNRLVPLEVSHLAAFTVFAWAGLAAMSLARGGVMHGVLVFAVVSVVGLNTHQELRSDDGHEQATRLAAYTIIKNVQQGDVIVHGPTDREALATRDLVSRYVSPKLRPADVLLQREARTGTSYYPRECADVAQCAGMPPRIWLIRLGSPSDPLAGMPAAKDGLLRGNYDVARMWPLRGLTVVLYVAKSSTADRPAPR